MDQIHHKKLLLYKNKSVIHPVHDQNCYTDNRYQEIRKKHGGNIKAAYGCSLGGSFVSFLIQRKRIHIEHGIIGSSDMDEAGKGVVIVYNKWDLVDKDEKTMLLLIYFLSNVYN